jgi:hypothetical protein
MPISWQSLAVAAATVTFVAFLLWKYRPRFSADSPLQTLPRLNAEVSQARDLVRAAKTPEAKAAALLRTAQAAARHPDHLTVAMGYYLRAMRANPTSPEPVLGLCRLLEKNRPEMLEAVLWRRLAQLPWTTPTSPAARSAAEGLAALYGRKLRNRDRELALRKLAERI